MYSIVDQPNITHQPDSDVARAMLNAMTEAVLLHADGVVIDGNTALEALLGQSLAAMWGRSLADILPPELRQAATAWLLDPPDEPTRWSLPTAKGPRWLEVSNRPCSAMDSSPALVTLRDVTELHQAQAAQRRRDDYERLTQEALRHSELQHRRRSQHLRQVVQVANALLAYDNLPAVWRRTVELLTGELGLERCAVLLREGDTLRGTFSVDRAGQVIDLSDLQRPLTAPLRNAVIYAGSRPWFVWDLPQANRLGDVASSGEESWLAVTPIRSGGEVIGLLLNDGAVTGAPFDPLTQEAVSVFASLLGHLVAQLRAAADLRWHKARYRAVISATGGVVYQRDWVTNRFTFMDTRVPHLLGYTREELTPERFDELVLQEAPEVISPLEEDAWEDQPGGTQSQVSRTVYAVRHRAGHLLWLADTAMQVRAPDGTLLVSLGILHDISEQRAAERERRLLATVVRRAEEAMVITDHSGTIIYVNPALERLVGRDSEDLLGQRGCRVRGGTADDAIDLAISVAMRQGVPWRGQFELTDADGQPRQLEASVSPVTDGSGQVSHSIGTLRDVTQERQLEERLQQASRLEAVGQLAGGVAHDFNNLLMTIGGFTDLVLADLPSDTPAVDDLRAIRQAADRAAELTKQLLAFGRRQMIDPQPVDLNHRIRDLAHILHRVVGPVIHVRLSLSEPLPPALADARQLDQVLLNLTFNARDAMPNGGTLTVSTDQVAAVAGQADTPGDLAPGDYLRLTVSDTGIGMDEATCRRVFEPFFTTKGLGHGTGLGLASAYGIVTQSGGAITCHSVLGQGTRFEIYLPASPQAAPMVPITEQQPAPAAPASQRVLVVEDEDPVREVVVRILRRQGYAVEQAASAEAALATIDERSTPAADSPPYDLLLTDVVMPGLSGAELAARLRERWPALPVLFMSGYADRALAQVQVAVAETAVLAKPFTPDSLARQVRAVLSTAE